jgi:hypothetical protein
MVRQSSELSFFGVFGMFGLFTISADFLQRVRTRRIVAY